MATIPEVMAIGWGYVQAGEWSRAEEVYRQVLAANPCVAQAWYLLGAVSQTRGKLDEAVASYRQALRLVPDFAEVCNNLALALQQQGQRAEAMALLRRAIQVKPDYADAYSNLGNALQDQGELDEAIACYLRAIHHQPDFADAHSNLGHALRARGQFAEAVACYDHALRLRPDHPEVHLSRALAWLQMGDFARGWAEHEWRLKCPKTAPPPIPRPAWDGSPLDGRAILLYAEHGLGDALQFVRYAPLVQERGGRVIVACRRPLVRLLATCRGVEQVITEGETLTEFDVYALFMALPGLFRTTLANIPAQVPYLTPDPAAVAGWRGALGPAAECKIGIAWQGNPEFGRDHHRSFRLAQLEPLARLEGVRLYSLQVGVGRDQLAEVAGRFPMTDLGDRLVDFMDTAAVVTNLDLVIAPDTAVAHLAGALGVPVWLALPFACDWRWLADRDDSPWYPTMRLFRQERWGDWDEVFQRMAGELRRRQ